jgi:hypothetical protein
MVLSLAEASSPYKLILHRLSSGLYDVNPEKDGEESCGAKYTWRGIHARRSRAKYIWGGRPPKLDKDLEDSDFRAIFQVFFVF